MKYGWHATFMPKPLFGENGSGMHTHQSLFKDGRNAFYDADDQYFLSDVGKAFIAGQLKHAREISLDLRPVGELLQAARARLRGAGVLRVVAPQPLGARARAALPPRQGAGHAHGAALPGPGVQPLPDLRGPAGGGARGHREGLRAARADGEEPLPPDARGAAGGSGIEQLPETLGEAIELTAESELVLRTLGEHMFNRYVEIKRQEWEDYRVQVTQWELDRYLRALEVVLAPRLVAELGVAAPGRRSIDDASDDGHQIRGPMSKTRAGTARPHDRVSSSTPKATTNPSSVRNDERQHRQHRNVPASTMPGRGDDAAGHGQARIMPSRAP